MVRQSCILYMLLHKSSQLTIPQLTALSKASTLLPPSYGIRSQCLPAALGIVNFVKSHMWDSSTRTLTRSYREGKGPQAQTDDYAFLVQGLLNLYEATGDESHVLFAEELQKRQDELFWDDHDGGYFASAEDAHVLVRMKDAQVGPYMTHTLSCLTQTPRTVRSPPQLRCQHTTSPAFHFCSHPSLKTMKLVPKRLSSAWDPSLLRHREQWDTLYLG